MIRIFGRPVFPVVSMGMIADLFSPKICASCETALAPGRRLEVCSECLEKAEYLDRPYCGVCGESFIVAAEDDRERMDGRTCANCRRQEPWYSFARAACRYEGRVRRIIQAFKFGGRRSLAGTLSAIIGSRRAEVSAVADGADEVTPVPMEKTREKERGYNQSFLIAREICPVFGLKNPVALLRKIRGTVPQVGLTRDERLSNVRGAFEIMAGAQVEGKVILLVDDVMTTGATVSECARVLMKAGAREVRVLAAARG